MALLRARMMEDMNLTGLVAKTQEVYSRRSASWQPRTGHRSEKADSLIISIACRTLCGAYQASVLKSPAFQIGTFGMEATTRPIRRTTAARLHDPRHSRPRSSGIEIIYTQSLLAWNA